MTGPVVGKGFDSKSLYRDFVGPPVTVIAVQTCNVETTVSSAKQNTGIERKQDQDAPAMAPAFNQRNLPTAGGRQMSTPGRVRSGTAPGGLRQGSAKTRAEWLFESLPFLQIKLCFPWPRC